MQEGTIGTGEAIRCFTERPHRPTKEEQLALERMDFPQRIRLRIGYDLLL
ncbi:MAG: hypothetical protein QG615_1078 [Nitrospirota bacterium]|nr:hypothetical protein [Nitrospirota bacterium]